MRSSWLCCVLFVVGCATTRDIHLPDGSRGRMVGCSGSEQDWGDCMNRAHELCDGAYRIVERYAGRDGTALAAGGPRGQTWYRSHERKMLVTCAR